VYTVLAVPVNTPENLGAVFAPKVGVAKLFYCSKYKNIVSTYPTGREQKTDIK
jgi:hypothetical protein